VYKEESVGGDAPLARSFPFHEREDVPPERAEVGRCAPFEPFEQREGPKRPCVDEAQQGSGGPALKHHAPVAPR
jgi:hypothetical protein